MAMALLSEQDKQQIESTVARVELMTAGEVVVAAVRRCHDYGGVRAVLTFTWTLAAACLLHAVWPDLSAWWLLVLQVPFGLTMWWVSGWGRMVRALVPSGSLAQVAQARAMQLFVERGVHLTRERSGLLILLAEMEHRVVILGDTGIHRHVGMEGWQEHVDTIVRGIRAGRAGAAVVAVLQQIGDVLAANFPRRADDTNELPDAVVEG